LETSNDPATYIPCPYRQYFSREYQQIADRFPGSGEAELALVWLVSRGDDRVAAIDALFAEHSGSPGMAVAAYHMRHRWYSEPETLSRLQQLIDESPHVIVRATSRFALAIVYEEFLAVRSSGGLQNSHLKSEVQQQMADVDATDETIDQLLQACLTELEPIAESEFEQRVLRRCQSLQFERSHLQVGTAAPATAGTDLNGEPWRLADNRGQVVLLSFWGDW